ncbi:cardiolipin synthase [Verticiella sediminum]|uniref:Cardiolipin synthase n=1 Tax=Verticiella sediminum TaxID=1247510 RepID=A0A556AVF7_9BURK|nr:cardiolipin synthase [Verticiella sediminum]TSH96914.1 cardiolipin synthase [Verticiella sediminum]
MTDIAWQTLLTSGWALYLVGLAFWIILQKRPPATTVAWILSLAALPILGYLIYYFFGPQRLKRFRLRRLRSRAAVDPDDKSAQAKESAFDAPVHLRQMARLGFASCDNPIATAQEADLLVDGAQTFDAIFTAIAEAREHVHLEYYIFATDRIGKALRDLLTQKAAEGVKVRLLIDALGSVTAGRRFFAPLTRAGGELAFFHDTRIGRRFRPVINFRTHRKIVVCDGKVGFVGGLNVTDDQDERVNPHAFHDVHLRITGGAVRWLQTVFLEDWLYTADKSRGKTPLENFERLMPQVSAGSEFVQILHSGPNDEREAIHRMQIAAIDNARERAWLTTPYFVPTAPAVFALISAAMRGVDVRVLVPERADSRIVSAAARSYYNELLNAGVRIWEFKDRMLHSKTLLVDEDCSFIGTANFDSRSFRLNYEVCALVYGARMAQRLHDQFEADLHYARRIPAQFRQSLPRRFMDACARLFSPVL